MRMGYADMDQWESKQERKAALMQKITGSFGKVRGCFGDRRMLLFIVFVALFLDNMLLTIVVPIIPDFLLDQRVKNKSAVIAKVLSDINDSCLEFLQEPEHGSTSRRVPIYASRGHSPHQHLSVYLEQLFEKEIFHRDAYFNIYELSSQSDGPNGARNATRPGQISEQVEYCKESVNKSIHRLRRETAGNEHIQIGVMFASKSVVQLMVNPLVGPLTNRIGYSIPMFTGFLIMFVSTVVFAFGKSYGVLFFARALQGVGSACSSVSGMGMLATVYTDDTERGRAFSWALSGLALGVLVGPPFGGICYEFINKEAPFLMLAILALFDGLLQLLALKPAVRPEAERGSSLWNLLRDPYILVAAGSLTFGNMGIAMLEPSLPLWMWEKMRAQGWQQGVAFLPCSISYLIGTNIFGPLATRIGRGVSAGLGMVICSICLCAMPFARIPEHLIVPMFGLGFAIGMVDSSMMPIMGYLVDLRHASVYGSVYAIADVAFCLGFAIGPIVSGSMVQTVGFSWMLWFISIVCALYSPLTLLLRNPPRRDEARALVDRNADKPPGSINNSAIGDPMNTATFTNLSLGATLGYDPTAGGQRSYGYN
ncbi:Synaptic vesicular amine transporter [Clonorchis sinensis]|uniref:Synaptic vesicular amine transporter n=2 Tax=Clonorchis sinensis TaxID=79923 RepID=A0A8T1MA54_CLOSI|nr:Synaptic vesicular amine transporter [Clonorchis sinensis]GAA51459.1 MFS transporter DHA1 family solute carrier family 18 (vesicular amine transporter) member 1/2 [Clonorchis sinensis]